MRGRSGGRFDRGVARRVTRKAMKYIDLQMQPTASRIAPRPQTEAGEGTVRLPEVVAVQ